MHVNENNAVKKYVTWLCALWHIISWQSAWHHAHSECRAQLAAESTCQRSFGETQSTTCTRTTHAHDAPGLVLGWGYGTADGWVNNVNHTWYALTLWQYSGDCKNHMYKWNGWHTDTSPPGEMFNITLVQANA